MCKIPFLSSSSVNATKSHSIFLPFWTQTETTACLWTSSGQQQQHQHRAGPVRQHQRGRRAGARSGLQHQHLLSGDHSRRLQKSQLWRHKEEEVSPVRIINLRLCTLTLWPHFAVWFSIKTSAASSVCYSSVQIRQTVRAARKEQNEDGSEEKHDRSGL